MFHKILIPLDGSELAETALEPAFLLAAKNEARVLLLRVPIIGEAISYGPGSHDFLWQEDFVDAGVQEAEDYLAQVSRRYEQPGVTISTSVIAGDPASTVVDHARTVGADLIVMSTHGRTGISRWVMGSVTERVLRHATCPVLVIRNEQPLTNILITLDGSALSETAIAPGMTIANQLGGSVTLLSVDQQQAREVAATAPALEQAESGLGDRVLDGAYNRAENYLTRVVRTRTRDEQIASEPVIEVIEGPAAASILDFADRSNTSLIVMATHGRSGLARWVYGSVTEKVLRNTNAAMLIVRPPLESLR